MASRKRPDSPQMGLLLGLPTPERLQIKISPKTLCGHEANDIEPAAETKVRLVPIDETIDEVTVTLGEGHRPYVVSYVRFNGTHFGSMSLTLPQLKQLIERASALLDTIAIDLDELDDYNAENELHEDEREPE